MNTMNTTKQNRYITLATILLFVAPVWGKIIAKGITHVHDYLAGDVYYYLVIARNVNTLGFFTYDQERLANSFHPLWQLCCIVLDRACLWFSVSILWIPVFLLAMSTVFICLAIVFLAKSFSVAHQRIPTSFMFLPFGVYALTKITVHPNYGTLWSYADGMESCLALLAYALLIYLMTRPRFLETARSALVLGLATSFIFLARLDHAFFAVALFPMLGAQCLLQRNGRRFFHAVLAGTLCSLIMLAYMGVNQYYFGIFMPLSGAIKSTFPHVVHEPFGHVLEELRPPYNSHNLWRLAQVVIPMLFALTFLWVAAFNTLRGKRQRPLDFALLVSAVFVLLLGLYNFFYVGYWGPGHWYFPVSTVFVSLVCFHGLGMLPPLFKSRRNERLLFVVKATAAVLLVLALFHVAYGRDEVMRLHDTGVYKLLAHEAEPLRAFYKDNPPKIIEYADGALAYASGFPAFPAYLLTADKAAVDLIYKRQVNLLEVAFGRGHDRVILWQLGATMPVHEGLDGDELLAALYKTNPFFVYAHLNSLPKPWPFRLVLEYVSAGQTLAVVHLHPVDGDDGI